MTESELRTYLADAPIRLLATVRDGQPYLLIAHGKRVGRVTPLPSRVADILPEGKIVTLLTIPHGEPPQGMNDREWDAWNAAESERMSSAAEAWCAQNLDPFIRSCAELGQLKRRLADAQHELECLQGDKSPQLMWFEFQQDGKPPQLMWFALTNKDRR